MVFMAFGCQAPYAAVAQCNAKGIFKVTQVTADHGMVHSLQHDGCLPCEHRLQRH